MWTKDNMGNRLLIIDDDPHICEGLKDRLEAMGYEVITVHDGRSGLALMVLETSRAPIDGVLLDVQMPVMDGIAVLREIRARYPRVPVLMMSAGLDRRILEEAVRMGARDYILKPFAATHLKQVCAQVFPLQRVEA
jgi:DNA-binding response OmpR family regulator